MLFGYSAPVAQLDRALVFGTKGWGFESLQARYIYQGIEGALLAHH